MRYGTDCRATSRMPSSAASPGVGTDRPSPKADTSGEFVVAGRGCQWPPGKPWKFGQTPDARDGAVAQCGGAPHAAQDGSGEVRRAVAMRGHALAAAGEPEPVGGGRRHRHRRADGRRQRRLGLGTARARAGAGCRSPGWRRCRSRSRPPRTRRAVSASRAAPEAPAHSGSDVPKLLPRSPSPAAESSASQAAWAATSASECPSSPCGSSGQASPARRSGYAVDEAVHVGADADAWGAWGL